MAFEMPSFLIGGNTGNTPESVKRQRAIAEALATKNGTPSNPWEGLSRMTEALLVNKKNADATAAETEGSASAKAIIDALIAKGDTAGLQDYMGALSDPWVQANPGMSAIAQAGFGQEMQQSDPAYQMGLEKMGLELDALRNPAPSTDAPEVKSFYDEATGQSVMKQWMPETQSWEQVGGVEAPSNGLTVVTNPDGTTTVTQGGSKALTEGQGKDVYFINQGSQALPILDEMGNALTSLGENIGSQVPVVGNYLKSTEYQQAEQAGKQFINALKRKESGAAVSETEEANYAAVYLPLPGDKKEVLEQKKRARANALLGIQMGLPASAILAMESAGIDLSTLATDAQAAPTDTGAPAGPAAPAGGIQPGPDGIYDASDYYKGDM